MNSFFITEDTLDEFFQTKCFFKSSGGSSGKVDYPGYMKTKHEDWLNDVDALISSTGSPFLGESSYDPSAPLTSMEQAIATFSAAVAALNHSTDWESAIETAKAKADTVIDDNYINDDIAAQSALLDDTINDEALPVFQAGMLTTNSVMTSAFVMGEAKIWSGKTKEINKYATALRLDSARIRTNFVFEGAKVILEQLRNALELDKVIATLSVDTYRLKIVALKEEIDKQIDIDEKDARWSFDKYQYAVDMLGGISGGTVSAGTRSSTAQSAIGGGLSGAAMGNQFGSGWGALGGGILGFGSAFL